MKALLVRVAELQKSYSSKNTPEMRERGEIIRDELPTALRQHIESFKSALGRFGHDCEIEGNDGDVLPVLSSEVD